MAGRIRPRVRGQSDFSIQRVAVAVGTAVACFVALSASGLSAAGARGSSSVGCTVRWAEDATLDGRVEALRVLPGGDAWAVGFINTYPPTAFLAHRQNGRWVERTVGRGILYSLSANSTSNVWAVGQTRPSAQASKTRLLHFDGRRWVSVKSPPSLTIAGRLWPWLAGRDQKFVYFARGAAVRAVRVPRSFVVSITGTDAHHAWVADLAWIRVWDGNGWSSVGHLHGDLSTQPRWQVIDAASTTDVWALDETLASTGTSMHWDGHRWRVFPYPNRFSTPLGLATVSANEAWALFYLGLLRWDGADWRAQRLPKSPPAPPGVRGRFWPVALDVDASNSIWLAGYRGRTGFGSKIVSTVFHGTCS